MDISIILVPILLVCVGIVIGLYMSSYHIEREKQRLIAECEAKEGKYKKQVKALEKNLKEFKKLEG